jgi:hypothetical protein
MRVDFCASVQQVSDSGGQTVALHKTLSALALALAAGTAAAVTPTSIIVFEEGASSNYEAIARNFGAIPGQLDTVLETSTGGDLTFWTNSYSGKPAAYAGSSVGRITLTPLGGNTVTLESFFLGAWPNTTRVVGYSIDDLSTAGLDVDQPDTSVDGTSGLVVFSGMTSATGIRITFGPDGFNGGINYIDYALQPVPEPATWAMLGIGIGLLGLRARR